jgi:hypothetical protein
MGMTAKASSATADRCDLCGYLFEGSFADRMRHLRRTHPAYTRGVLLRVSAPFVFLVLVAALAALHAPTNAYIVALVATYALLFFGKQASRSQRKQAGLRATPPVKKTLREGGLSFVLLIPILAVLLLFLSKR